MNQEMKTKWVAALRSGKYAQGRERLRNGNLFCCLGVLCDVSGLAEWGHDSSYGESGEGDFAAFGDIAAVGVLPMHIVEQIGLTEEEHERCWTMNDNDGKTFSEIADYIEKHL